MDVTKMDSSCSSGAFSDPDHCSLSSFTGGTSGDSFTDSVLTVNSKADSLEKFDVKCDESIAFTDTSALCDDLRFITEMPEMCDVKFLVGKEKIPVYGVKAILATRSRTFQNMILVQENRDRGAPHRKFGLLSKLRKLRRSCLPSGNRKSKSSGHVTIGVDEFDPDTFQRIVSYVHSGNTKIDIFNVIGLMNAADAYGLGDLRTACYQYARRHVNMKTVFKLLTSTEKYKDSKWTKHIMDVVLTFISKKAQQILQHPDFTSVSKETAILILSRPELRATEETKWDAALRWSRRHCVNECVDHLRSLLDSLTPSINFRNIPLPKLQQEIQPLDILTADVIDTAISHQSSPRLVIGQEGPPSRSFKLSPSRRQSIRIVRGYFHRKLLLTAPSYFDSSDSGFVHSSEDCSKLKTLAIL